MRSKTPSAKAKGDALEKEVAVHYEALGYKVVRNSNVAGHQIDILASKYVSGAALFNLMIEAKFRNGGTVGISDVTPFLNTATTLLARSEIQAAVLVTDGGFSQDAQSAARSRAGIRLLTTQELEQDLFNYSESLVKTRYDYEASQIFHEYIPLAGSLRGRKKSVKNIASFILQWAQKHPDLLVLVGDFGSGKSTVFERAFYNQAVHRLNEVRTLFPVFLRLRRLLHYPDLWDFVSSSLRDNQYIAPTRNVFLSQLNAGKLLIFLDGFDEIDTGADAADRAEYLKRLLPLLTSASPCIMSTRPTYFESFLEMSKTLNAILDRAPSFERLPTNAVDINAFLERLNIGGGEKLPRKMLENVLEIDQLTDDKIVKYLRNFETAIKQTTSRSLTEVKSFLYQIYDLEDLMKRPLLLNMVVTTILAQRVDITAKDFTLGPATLYDLYTQICVKRDFEKGKENQFLDERERLAVCRQVALKMLDKGSIEITGIEVLQAIEDARLGTIARLARTLRAEALQRALTDIRVCSFLVFSDDSSLRFAHKSYFEFFVAQAVFVATQKSVGDTARFATRPLGREVLYFLSSFARDHDAFGRLMVAFLRDSRSGDSDLMRFVYRIVFGSGVLLERAALTDGRIVSVDLHKVSVSSTQFGGVDFEDVRVNDLRAFKWNLKRCAWKSVAVRASKFTDGVLELRMEDCEFASTEFENCRLDFSGGCLMQDTKFQTTNVRLSGEYRLSATSFSKCDDITLEPTLRLQRGTKIEFDECGIVGPEKEGWYEDEVGLEFRDSLLCGVWVDATDLVALVERSSRKIRTRIVFSGCRGIVLTRDFRDVLTAKHLADLRKLYPALLFFDTDTLNRSLSIRERYARRAHGKTARAGVQEMKDRGGLPQLLEISNFITSNGLAKKVTGILAKVMRS